MQESNNPALKSMFDKIKQIISSVNPSLKIDQLTEDSDDLLMNIQLCIDWLYRETVQQDHRQDQNMYGQIESELQKQENINRTLIKKELEFKEYQKCIIEELNEQRRTGRKLKSQLSNYEKLLHQKDLDLLHLANEKRMVARDKKLREMLNYQTLHERKNPSELYKDVYKESTAKKHQRRRSEEVSKKTSKKNKIGNLTKR